MSEASEAMSLAGQYRAEGYDPSTALQMGWDEVRGGSNPGESMVEAISNPIAPSGIGGLLMLAGAFTVIWKLWKKEWWWESIQLGREKAAGVLEAQRIAQAKKNPGINVYDVRHIATDPTRESTGIITP